MFLFILIYLLLATDLNANNNKIDSDVSLLRIELLDSLNNQNKEIITIKADFKLQEQILKNKLDNASSTIEYLNSLVSTFGIIFTILAIFIVIITLAVPILTYLFGVKPSQKALKDLEDNMDTKFEEYLNNTRNIQIEKALSDIKGDDIELTNLGLSFLAFTQHIGFSDNQIFQIYNILKNTQIEPTTKSQLAYILSNRKHDIASDFFNSKEVIKDPVLKQMALLYYAKTGFSENYPGIKNILENISSQYEDFQALLFNVHHYSNNAIQLLNDLIIIDILVEDTLTKVKSDIHYILESINIDQTEFGKSYLCKKIEKKHYKI